jgi:hypothetical protein
MYPPPSTNVAIDTPLLFDRGTRTEYTVDADIPANQVYLWQQLAEFIRLASLKLTS